jgi:hypothetical protein
VQRLRREIAELRRENYSLKQALGSPTPVSTTDTSLPSLQTKQNQPGRGYSISPSAASSNLDCMSNDGSPLAEISAMRSLSMSSVGLAPYTEAMPMQGLSSSAYRTYSQPDLRQASQGSNASSDYSLSPSSQSTFLSLNTNLVGSLDAPIDMSSDQSRSNTRTR